MKQTAWFCAFGIAITVAAIHGHHSLAGIYDTNRQVKIEGVVAQFHFVKPHATVAVGNGQPIRAFGRRHDSRYLEAR
jgi:hypothetical protein